MMCLHFGHGHDEIGRENGSWKPQEAQTGIVGLKLRFDQLVAIEIDKCDLAMRNLIAEAGVVYKQICVAMMSWPFANGYGGRIESKEGFRRGADKLTVRIHGFSRKVFDN